MGGGCEMSMACDIRIAADNSRFGIPVARLGILVGYREMRRLINLVGPGNASYILLSARLLDSAEALRVGLVNQVVPLAEIDDCVYDLAREMVPLAPLSQARHKLIRQIVLEESGAGGTYGRGAGYCRSPTSTARTFRRGAPPSWSAASPGSGGDDPLRTRRTRRFFSVYPTNISCP